MNLLFQVMENLQNLINLQELWLGRNRIKTVNLCGLKCIKKISLQSNRLTSMAGFEVHCGLLFGPQARQFCNDNAVISYVINDIWVMIMTKFVGMHCS